MSAVDLLLGYPFLQRAFLAALLVALLCGVLGVYVVLRGLSMLGDGLAHISFAGVAIGLVAGIYPLAVALVVAVAGALVIQALRSREVVRADTAVGILFTAGLALGILVVSRGRAGVDVASYLFGNLLAVTSGDLVLVSVLAALLLGLFFAFQKEMLYVTFSEEAARLSGLPVAALNTLFTVATAVSVVVAARIVGVLLVSALLVVPAAAALQRTRSFRATLVASVLYGTGSVVLGTLAALQWDAATGASIALASTFLFAAAVMVRAARARLTA